MSLMFNIADGINIYPKVIEKHLTEELPFMATENILMYCVKKGGNRQELHERIRIHSVETTKKIKLDGGDNDLLERILGDAAFDITAKELAQIMNAEQFTGRAKEQTKEFLEEVKKILDANHELLGLEVEILC